MNSNVQACHADYRLPVNVKPTHYDITIKTDLERVEFQGFVKISLNVKNETFRIVLNSSHLHLHKAILKSDIPDLTQEESARISEPSKERVTFIFPKSLPSGSKAELRVGFEGRFANETVGYYRSSYIQDGQTKYHSLTQFEPTHARRAFPCWDEPLLKSTFAITLLSRVDTVNLSNMPVNAEEDCDTCAGTSDALQFLSPFISKEEKWKMASFQTTPPMSSYLVAFANGPFQFIERVVELPISKKAIPLRVYTTPKLTHQAQFVLDVKYQVLPLYEKLFDIEYPLPKLDTLVASDFLGVLCHNLEYSYITFLSSEAMENWGLIIGEARSMLLDPEKVDLKSEKQAMKLQSHEIAHMWFGNITTMEWWNDLYLNEGFATLMGGVIIPGKVFPEWKSDSSFITEELYAALTLDAKLSSHPIEVDLPDASRITQLFDDLSYDKAASVLRMLANYVGEEKFLKGVSIYLKKRLFGNSVTKDLWEGISEVTGLNIVYLMENWISKTGFPVLTVTETTDGIHIRQDRFLETGCAEGEDNVTLWNVPLGILTVDEGGKSLIDQSQTLTSRETTIPLDTSKPFKLNANTTGVYRVLYAPEILEKIRHEMIKENSCFSLNDKLGLINDSMALSKAGLAKLGSILSLIESLKNEKEYLVWSDISISIAGIISIWWEYPRIVEKLDAFRRVLFMPLAEQLGYEHNDGETADTTMLRTCAITQAALAGDQRVVQELRDRFAHYMKTGDDSVIPVDLQQITFHVAVKHGGADEYDAVRRLYDKPNTETQRTSAIHAMGLAQDPKLMKRTFGLIIQNTRVQEIMPFLHGLLANFRARHALLQFFMDEYDTIYKQCEDTFILPDVIQIPLSCFSTQKDYDRIKEFFRGKDTSRYDMALAQALDGILARMILINKATEELEDWVGRW
ncbi:hypothetical protein AMATHDRAFT_198286 [Amanita thiersii Skay4041]|uniref:Aminopeptidase n=1 Tax=Amanita thiersii Skay4041 TaxID=703135 RepID=A0A2A9NG76_9AGAR|nr:hypothetical protein AMATHDRAFT_198286 [Amanita thiersii Skay4041]